MLYLAAPKKTNNKPVGQLWYSTFPILLANSKAHWMNNIDYLKVGLTCIACLTQTSRPLIQANASYTSTNIFLFCIVSTVTNKSNFLLTC